MIKHVTFIWIIVFTSNLLFAQQRVQVDLVQNRSKIHQEQVRTKTNGLILSESIAGFELVEKSTKEGNYGQLVVEGLSKTYNAGNPDLPVINRLIEIPHNSDVEIKIVSYNEEIIKLNEKGFKNLIIPAQPSHSKSQDAKDIPFEKNKEVYGKDEFYKRELVKFEDKGYLRNKHLGYIEISPFMYNPVSNVLKVLNNIEVEITFVPSTKTKVLSEAKLQSPYFDQINYNVINQTSGSKAVISDPVKYVIVADRMFEETLQDFILWKTQKGFNVVEAYTDVIGTTTSSIKTYLQDLYENPVDDVAPTFVLLVGDVAQIPTFSGTAGSHKTDLYYFEYTGDKLPEVFYGRFSAESVEELQPQIDKTLEIEKFEMPDPSYLDNVVLVAGVDQTYAPTYGNGAINYANTYYTNSENGINSYYYLYGDASGVMSSSSSEASASIRSYISAGVSFSNYTAHCGVSGWSDPSFSISHIDGLTNEHMYPLIIGNCCQSNTFNSDDCFGEEILMAANKGAVGYIGGSNNTYWDEDYYWGIGLTNSIEANPTYEESGLGAYDRFFHLNGEDKSDWYITQGQINVAGNLAVEASTSSRKAYYWEIYHLMGDPSLTPYVTVPSVLTASYDSEAFIGYESFNVTAEENAYVALSDNGVLLDAALVDESGSVTLTFDALPEATTLDLVITKQNRQPIIDQIAVIPSTTPYVKLNDYIINDNAGNSNSEVEYGETINVDIELLNIAKDYDAYNVVANLSSADTNIVIVDNTESFGTILSEDSVSVSASYIVQFKNKFSNQQVVDFNLEITGENSGGDEYTWNDEMSLTVNAPELNIEYFGIDDIAGNNDGYADPGERANIFVKVTNIGKATIEDFNANFGLVGTNDNITIHNNEITNLSLAPGGSDTLQFDFSVAEIEPFGSSLDVLFKTKDNLYNFYNDTLIYEITLGNIKKIRIDSLDQVSVDKFLLFYDSGGKENSYSNYEDDSITFYPKNERGILSVEFNSFDVEPNGGGCYDYLEIYDGENTNATLIGSFCNSNKPTTYTATNSKGALTFRFKSDQNVTPAGWEAKITNTGNLVKIIVNNQDGVVENAIVEFNDEEKYTNVNGEAYFFYVTSGNNLSYIIRKAAYENLTGLVNIDSDTTINLVIEEGIPQFKATFKVANESKSIYNAEVILDSDTVITNSKGEAVFDGLFEKNNIPYSISKEHFNKVQGTIDINGDNVLVDTILDYESYDIVFNVNDGESPVENASIEFNEETKYTDAQGTATFSPKYSLNQKYKISKEGYKVDSGMINVDVSKSLDIILDLQRYDVMFVAMDPALHVIENVLVEFNSTSKYTNSSGEALFSNISPGNNMEFSLSADGFWNYDSTLNVENKNVVFNAIMSSTTSVAEFEKNDIKIYPNPSNGLFTIEMNGNLSATYQIKIYDITGSVVYSKKIQNQQFINEHVNVSHKSKGIYLLYIKSDSGEITKTRLLLQ